MTAPLPSPDDCRKVVQLELALLTAGVRGSREQLEALLDPEFSEIGASGRSWTRPDMIEMLLDESARGDAPGPEIAVGLAARPIAPDVVLVTYRTETAARTVLRTSLWRRTGGPWRLVHHQGTPVPQSALGPPRR